MKNTKKIPILKSKVVIKNYSSKVVLLPLPTTTKNTITIIEKEEVKLLDEQ